MQERVLSQRLLIFSTDASQWECPTTIFNDVSADDEVGALKAGSIPSTSDLSLDRWDSIVNAYSHRSITYETDKLPAFSGIIQVLEKRYKDKCIVGVWQRDYHISLLWMVDHSQRYAKKIAKRPNAWRAPSWSFLSLEARVEYLNIASAEGGRPVGEAKAWQVDPLNMRNPHGELQGGYLMINAPMIELPVAPSEMSHELVSLFELDGRLLRVTVYWDIEQIIPCWILAVINLAGLLVVPTGTAPNEYRRVGVATFYHDDSLDHMGRLIGGLKNEDFPTASLVKLV